MRALLSPVRLLGAATLSLALIAPAVPAAATPSHSFGTAPPAASQGHQAATGDPTVTIRRDQRGHAHYIGAAAGRVLARNADRTASPAAAAREHLGRFAADFGVTSPGRDLRTASVQELAKDRSVVRFQQTADGLPVLGGQLVSVLDGANSLLSVSGETSTAVRSSTYSVTASSARAAAVRVTAAEHGLAARELLAAAPERWLYDASLFDAKAAAGSRAVWRVEVTARDQLDVRELVLVDGATGRVALQVDQIQYAGPAAHRVVCDNGRRGNDDYLCRSGRYARTEAGPASSVLDVEQAFANAGAAWDFYDSLGVDLTALIGADYGDGKRLRSTVQVCPKGGPCPYDNAFWDGFQMVYGVGFPRADDVVGHELTHGVTQHTSGLAYWYQSGAINESMSDVFGEFIDHSQGADDDSTWLLGEDLPNQPPARSMKNPPDFDQPDRVGGTNWTDGRSGGQTDDDNGGVHTNSGVGNKAAYLITAGTTGEPGGTFNGESFPGLTVDKAKWIYWGAQNLLTPGADYADLADGLYASCTALVGNHGIVLADCDDTVKPATEATQMLPPSGPSVPRNVTITGGYGVMRIQWTAPATSGPKPVNSYLLTVTPSIGGESSLAIDDPGVRDVSIGGVPAGRTLAFSLVAVTSAGNSPPSPPITLRGTKLSLSAPASVPYKRQVELTGRLTFNNNGDGVAGRQVRLYRKVDGKKGFRFVRSKPTSSSGAFTFRPRQKRDATYFIYFPANSTLMFGSRSAKHGVAVRHRVSFRSDDLSLRKGQTVHFSGRIRPADRGNVTVHRRRVGESTWTAFATDAVNSHGRYRLAWTPKSGRDFEWRVVVKGSPTVSRGVSRTLLVRVA